MSKYMDKLDKIYSLQEHLNLRIIEGRKLEMNRNDWMIKWVLASFSELNEIMNELNWKHWKNPTPLFIPNLKEEVVDLLHFVISMALELGMDSEELFDLYVAKNEENHDRQDGTVVGREDYKPEEV